MVSLNSEISCEQMTSSEAVEVMVRNQPPSSDHVGLNLTSSTSGQRDLLGKLLTSKMQGAGIHSSQGC